MDFCPLFYSHSTVSFLQAGASSQQVLEQQPTMLLQQQPTMMVQQQPPMMMLMQRQQPPMIGNANRCILIHDNMYKKFLSQWQ
jgi:hypothetical protein